MPLRWLQLLVPLNFILFAVMRERGLAIAGIAPRFGLLVFESVVVAVVCRPEISVRTAHPSELSGVPVWAMAGLVAAVGMFIRRYLQGRKPIEPGFVWSVTAVVLWAGDSRRLARAPMPTSPRRL